MTSSRDFSNKEITALKQFRTSISDIIHRLDEFDSHDANLIRWIRAREFNLSKAEDMLRKSLEWRRENDIDRVLERKIPDEVLDDLPFYCVGHDKEGAIICIIALGKWDLKTIFELGYRENVKEFVNQILERGFKYMKMRSSQKKVYTQFVIIFDFEDFSVSQVLSKEVVGFMMEALRMFEAQYPETMKAAYAINAPKIFELLWAFLKPLLTQHTLGKCSIFGCNSEQWRKVLTTNIDYTQLPSQYGGSNNCHPFYINEHGTTWPPRAKLMPEEDFLATVVPAGEKFVRHFKLVAGDRISWNYKTDSYDIGFQFLYEGQPIYAYAKADAHICVQEGLIDVEEDGTYTLVFDNTYSRYRAKNLYYAVQLEKTPPFDEKTHPKFSWCMIQQQFILTHNNFV